MFGIQIQPILDQAYQNETTSEQVKHSKLDQAWLRFHEKISEAVDREAKEIVKSADEIKTELL